MQEHALLIPRVSGNHQREEDQTPGLQAYADRKGYVVDPGCIVPVHGRSAFHGKHVKYILDAVEKHVRNGNCTVVIFRHVDRSSREGVFKGFALLNKIMEAGARIEFSEQEFLNNNPGWIGPLFELAKEESKIKHDRTLQGNGVKREAGKIVGREPWGYDAVLDSNGKRVGIKPNDLGRKWVPYIFESARDGKSLRTISDSLKGVPSPKKDGLWGETAVRRVINRTTYYGAMKGNPNLEFEALISVELWKQANIALQSRQRGGRSPVKRERPFAKPVCGNCYGVKRDGAPSGRSPMYVTGGIRPVSSPLYYRCSGHGRERSGCGTAMISVEKLNAAIDATMASDTRPHETTVIVAGDDNDERRNLINEKIKAATEAGNYELLMQLGREAMEIGPSARKSTTRAVKSGMTVGKHWQTLSPEGKRDELLKWEIIAYPDHVKIVGPWHDEPGRTVIGDMIEAEDTQ